MQQNEGSSELDELILFTHAAIFEEKMGELRITTIRVAWHSNIDKSARVSLPWNQIVKDQYSPESTPDVMLRISTMSRSDALVFMLVGSPRAAMRSELLRLKSIMHEARRYKTSTASTETEVKVHRAALLNADRILFKHYVDLVRSVSRSKLIFLLFFL